MFHRITLISSKQNKSHNGKKKLKTTEKKIRTFLPPQKNPNPSVTEFSKNKKVPKIAKAYVVWTSRGQGGKTYINKKKLN